MSKEDDDILNEEKDESNSIRTQRLLVYNFISEEDDLKELEVIEYVDDGYSGKNFERPEIKRLLNDVRKNKIQCVVVKDFSRFGRDHIEVGNYIEKVFPFMNIRFIAVNNHFDSITMKTGEVPDLDFSFQNLIYDYYSVENSIKTKKGQEKRRREGKYMAVYAPYGYMKDPRDKNHLIIDEEAAMHVRNIFKWYHAGETKANIARILDAKGILTPAQYMTAKGSDYTWRYKESQGKWSGAIIGRILRNRIYTGDLVSGKTEAIEIGGKKVRYKHKDDWCITQNTHQSIISKEHFEEVQSYKKPALSNTDRHKRVVEDSVLKGYLRCGGCKHKLTKRNRLHVSFYCRYYYELHDEKCVKSNITQDNIVEIVRNIVGVQLLLAGNIKYLEDIKHHLEQVRERVWKERIHIIEVERRKLEKENLHRYELFQTGEIGKDLYLKRKGKNTERLKQIDEVLFKYRDISDNITQEDQTFLDVLEQSGNIKSLSKDLMEILFKTIEVYPGNRLVIHMKYKSIWSITPNKRD